MTKSSRRRGLIAGAALLLTGAGLAVVPLFTASAAAPADGITLRVAHTGKCANVQGGVTTNSARVIQFTCDADAPHDKWKAVPMGDGTYRVVAPFSGKCLNVQGGSTADNARAIQFTCSPTGRNDRWRFEAVPDAPTYRLRAAHSGKCLRVRDAGTANSAALVQFTCARSAARHEQWYVPPTASPDPVALDRTRDTPVVAIQAGGEMAPVTYAYVDDEGELRHGHQDNPDDPGNTTWTTISGSGSYAGRPVLTTLPGGAVQVGAHSTSDSDLRLGIPGAGSNTFDDWRDVGGAFATQPVGATPAGATAPVHFAVVNGSVWHLPQVGRNTPYAGWRHLGGSRLTGTLDVARVREGLRLSALDRAGHLWTATYHTAGTLTGWADLGGNLTGAPATVVLPGSAVRFFATTTDGRVVTRGQGVDDAWEADWRPVGTQGFTAAGPPAAVLDEAYGTVEVVVRGTDGRVHYAGETGNGSAEWGSWITASSAVAATDPTIVTHKGAPIPLPGGGTCACAAWSYVVRDAGHVVTVVSRAYPQAATRAAPTKAPFVTHRLPVG